MNSSSPPRSENNRPLALLLVVAGCVLVIVFRVYPFSMRGVNFVPAGALLLFAGARLAPKSLFLLAFIPLLATDVYLFQVKNWEFPFFNYASWAVYLLLGWWMLRKTESPWRIGTLAVVSGLQFFLITNFGVWLQQAIRPEMYSGQSFEYSANFAGLMKCYEMGIPFLRGTLLSDILFTGVFFGAHLLLARAYSPHELVAPIPSSEKQS